MPEGQSSERRNRGGGQQRRGRETPQRDRRRDSRGGEAETGRSLGAPTGARAPIGLDRARSRAGAPPRPGREAAAPPRPELPEDEEPQLPKGVRREIDRVIGKNRRGREIALALSIGAAAIEEERLDVALPMLAWAKHEAPRIAAVREAYGVALYLEEQYPAALSELQAYKRITGKVDQNHLIADCLRALERGVDRVVDAAAALANADDAPEDRRAEAAIVWASALADSGDVGAGRAVLRKYLARIGAGRAEHVLRVRYVAAELAERDGDAAEAREQFLTIRAADPDFLDVDERLASLDG
ncbi:hypothetical protein [Egicoccus sp. AB-alg2]|uniref:hypothetical protein n=1 Tax=Egicoccus sp. AB-alg2 TaxID=3242693 RepID=UPI00359EF7A9